MDRLEARAGVVRQLVASQARCSQARLGGLDHAHRLALALIRIGREGQLSAPGGGGERRARLDRELVGGHVLRGEGHRFGQVALEARQRLSGR